ncbi:MAG: hypothetical protein QM703_14845 [Gemmatales bacterium]
MVLRQDQVRHAQHALQEDMMVSGKTASMKHLIVALLVLTPIALLPAMLLEPRTNHDPILKSEELETILKEYTPDAKRRNSQAHQCA